MRTTVAVTVPAGPLWAMFIDQVATRPAAAAVDTGLPGDAKAQESMRAMQRVIDDEAQRANFREFLRTLAEDGNRHALEVLRSASAPALPFAKSRQDGFSGNDNAVIALKHELQHTVAKNGDVSYTFDGKEILRDLGTTVLVIDKADAGMLMGLRLAQAKFGQAISMHGDADFIERNCFIAAKNGLDISFKDPAHQAVLDRYRESIRRQLQAEADRDRLTLPSDVGLPGLPLGARLHDLSDRIAAVVDKRSTDRRVDEASAAAVASLARKKHLENEYEGVLPSTKSNARRPAAAIANGSEAPPARKTYRHQMQHQMYGKSSENLAKYWRVDKSNQGVVFTNKCGRVVDRGVSIHCDHGNDKEIGAMIEVAKIKGWKSIATVGGSDDFKYRAMMSSLRAQLDVVATNDADKAILAKVKMDLKGSGGSGGSAIGGIGRGSANVAADEAKTKSAADLVSGMSTMLGGQDRRK